LRSVETKDIQISITSFEDFSARNERETYSGKCEKLRGFSITKSFNSIGVTPLLIVGGIYEELIIINLAGCVVEDEAKGD
jgi:hypothetical protein